MAANTPKGVIVNADLLTPRSKGWTVVFDAELTRRKVFHGLYSASEELVYRSRSVTDLMDFLDDQEIYEYTVLTASGAFAVTSRRVKRNRKV